MFNKLKHYIANIKEQLEESRIQREKEARWKKYFQASYDWRWR